jgi:hypothetical protein
MPSDMSAGEASTPAESMLVMAQERSIRIVMGVNVPARTSFLRCGSIPSSLSILTDTISTPSPSTSRANRRARFHDDAIRRKRKNEKGASFEAECTEEALVIREGLIASDAQGRSGQSTEAPSHHDIHVRESHGGRHPAIQTQSVHEALGLDAPVHRHSQVIGGYIHYGTDEARLEAIHDGDDHDEGRNAQAYACCGEHGSSDIALPPSGEEIAMRYEAYPEWGLQRISSA